MQPTINPEHLATAIRAVRHALCNDPDRFSIMGLNLLQTKGKPYQLQVEATDGHRSATYPITISALMLKPGCGRVIEPEHINAVLGTLDLLASAMLDAVQIRVKGDELILGMNSLTVPLRSAAVPFPSIDDVTPCTAATVVQVQIKPLIGAVRRVCVEHAAQAACTLQELNAELKQAYQARKDAVAEARESGVYGAIGKAQLDAAPAIAQAKELLESARRSNNAKPVRLFVSADGLYIDLPLRKALRHAEDIKPARLDAVCDLDPNQKPVQLDGNYLLAALKAARVADDVQLELRHKLAPVVLRSGPLTQMIMPRRSS